MFRCKQSDGGKEENLECDAGGRSELHLCHIYTVASDSTEAETPNMFSSRVSKKSYKTAFIENRVWNSCEVIIYNLSEPAGPRSSWRWWRATRRRFSPCWPCSVTVRGVRPLLFQISLKYRRSPQPVSFSHESWFPWRPPGQRGARRCPRRREQLRRLSSLQ